MHSVFVHGETVRIANGVLQGLTGIFVEFAENGNAVVSVEGRFRVIIDPGRLERPVANGLEFHDVSSLANLDPLSRRSVLSC